MDSATAALLGALIGSALPIAANIYNEFRARRQRAKHISLAVRGEISAVLEIVRQRNYVDGIRAAEQQARDGGADLYTMRATFPYFPVVEASLADLGILPDRLPSLIPRFLTYAKSALEDFQAINDGAWSERDSNELCESYKELGVVIDKAMATAADIIDIIEKHYRLKPRLKKEN